MQRILDENAALRDKLEAMHREAWTNENTKRRVKALNEYDEEVQKLIAADHNLQEAWDNFRVLYQLTAGKPLLETANQKILGEIDGTCYGCRRRYNGSSLDAQRDAKLNVIRIRNLEAKLRELGAEDLD
jgi:energy-coupling factor transporter ATP-binding protein EcfA2